MGKRESERRNVGALPQSNAIAPAIMGWGFRLNTSWHWWKPSSYRPSRSSAVAL